LNSSICCDARLNGEAVAIIRFMLDAVKIV